MHTLRPAMAAAAGLARAAMAMPRGRIRALPLARELFTAADTDWMPPREEADAMKARLSAAKKAAAMPPELQGATPRPVTSACVVGSGTMGAGIAMCFAEARIPVTLHDSDRVALDRALARMRTTWQSTTPEKPKTRCAAHRVRERLEGHLRAALAELLPGAVRVRIVHVQVREDAHDLAPQPVPMDA